jgi:hypothetical protein
MDITSFILGISSVIVVALVTGVVIGLVKIQNLIKTQLGMSMLIDTNAQNVYNELNAIQDADDKRWVEHRRSLDSRLDKLIARLDVLEDNERTITRFSFFSNKGDGHGLLNIFHHNICCDSFIRNRLFILGNLSD